MSRIKKSNRYENRAESAAITIHDEESEQKSFKSKSKDALGAYRSYHGEFTVVSRSISPETTIARQNESMQRSGSNSKLGKKALMRKLMMKNANTKLDFIVAKYNYTGKRDRARTTLSQKKSGNAVFVKKRGADLSKEFS